MEKALAKNEAVKGKIDAFKVRKLLYIASYYIDKGPLNILNFLFKRKKLPDTGIRFAYNKFGQGYNLCLHYKIK